MRKVEAPKEPEEKPVEEAPQRRQRNLSRQPYWSRRAAIMRDTGTTGRDLFESDPFIVEGPEEVMRNMSFCWMSDIIVRKHPILTNYSYDIWEPVTPELFEELGISVRTRDRTPEGVPKVGYDASLYCCPTEIAKEQFETMMKPHQDIKKMLKSQKESLRGKFGDDLEVIGDARLIDSEEQLGRESDRQAKQIGTPFTQRQEG
jgi:hypothetical protein